MKSFTQKLRTTTICLITAAALALPGISHAGAIDTIKLKVTDVQNKLNSVYGQVRSSAPLINVMKEGKLINDLKEIMLFLNESRSDYDQFANTGIYAFSQDISGLVYGFGDIGTTMNLDGLAERLDKSQDLINRLPPQLMYIMHKAVGTIVIELREDVQSLNEKLAAVADLPSNSEMIESPELHKAKLCPLVNDKKTKVTYTVLMAKLKLLSMKLDYVNDLIPDDMTVVVNVVGGGGTNVPSPVKPITGFFKYIKDRIIQRLENAHDIASVVCG
jgi:hypothetical protein